MPQFGVELRKHGGDECHTLPGLTLPTRRSALPAARSARLARRWTPRSYTLRDSTPPTAEPEHTESPSSHGSGHVLLNRLVRLVRHHC